MKNNIIFSKLKSFFFNMKNNNIINNINIIIHQK